MNTASRAVACLALVATLVLATGCNTVGPRAVRTAGVDYNRAMNDAYNEQVLLNLVRLRYRDAPYFLEPGQLVTSHVLGGSAAVGSTLGAGSADVDAAVGYSYEESPAVIYTPLTGEAFLERLLTPVQVETLYLLMRSGWSIERVLRCCVRQVNDLLNAPSADGPTPSYTPEYRDFRLLAEELRRLQKSRDLLLDSAAVSGGEDGDAGGAGRSGDAGKDGGDGGGDDGDDGEERRPFFLELTPQAVKVLGEMEVRRREAVLPPGTGVGTADGPTRLELVPEQRSGVPGKVVLHSRSLMGVLYFLSQGVEAPQEHVDRGLVTATAAEPEPPDWAGDPDPDALNPPQGECARDREWACPAGRDCLDWTETVLGDLFRVRVSAKNPGVSAYVAVRYRGYWFYIADCDLQSKSTYLLLKQLFSLQSGDPKDRSSVLNYSLGG